MAVKVTSTLTLSGRELAVLKKALEMYKITGSEYENRTVNDLIELVDNLKDKIKLDQKKKEFIKNFKSTINPYYLR